MFLTLFAFAFLLILLGLVMEYGLEGLLGMLIEVADPLIEFVENLIGLEIFEEALQILRIIIL